MRPRPLPATSTLPPRPRAAALAALAALALAGCAHYDYARYEAKPLDPAKSAAALVARSLDDPGLRKFLTENLHKDFSLGKPVEWDFETLCWVAFYFNPTLDVARAQWESARAAQTTAAARPNPSLTLTPGFSSNPGGASPWLPAVGLDFAIDPAAQRDRRAEVARLNAEAARQAVFAAAWQVRADLRRALLDLGLASRRAEQLHAQAELRQQIFTLLEQRRTAGAATATEVAAARLASMKAENAAVDAEGLSGVPPAQQRVAQVLGLPWAKITHTQFPAGAAPHPLTPVFPARTQALQGRADVLGALARYAVAESAVALEVERQHPGLHLGPGYQWDQGQNKWTVAFTFELPLHDHNEGPLAEAEARRREAAAQLTVVQAQVLAEIDSAVGAELVTGAQAYGSRQVRDEMNKQLTLVESRLHAGAADQLDLQNARLELSIAQQALIEAATQADFAHGQLEDALQVPIANLDALAPAERAPPATVFQKTP